MTRKKKTLIVILALFLILALWDAWIFHFHTPKWDPLWETTSPDGRFTVSVYDNQGLISLPPWLHPRGYAGTVVLRENKTGKVLQQAKASVDWKTRDPHIRWHPEFNDVEIVSVGAWDLPTD